MCGAKLFSKMLSGGQNPQLHTVTLHLVCGIRNGGGELGKKRGEEGAQEERDGEREGLEEGWRRGKGSGKRFEGEKFRKKQQTEEMKGGNKGVLNVSAEC